MSHTSAVYRTAVVLLHWAVLLALWWMPPVGYAGGANQSVVQAVASSQRWRDQQGQVAIDWPLLLDGSPLPHMGTIQALLRLGGNEQQLPFAQLGFHRYTNGRSVTFGLGHRWHNSPETRWGLNLFYDHQLKACHQRASIGIERQQALLKLATNVYLPLSRYRTVKNSGTDTVRPASGLDLLVDSTLPHYPWLGFRVLSEYYAGDTGTVLGSQGFKALPYPAVTLGVHYTPIPLLTLHYDYTVDKQQRHAYQVRLRLSYRFDHSPSEQLDSETVKRLRTGNDSPLALVARHGRLVLRKNTRLVASSPSNPGNPSSTDGNGTAIVTLEELKALEQERVKKIRFLEWVKTQGEINPAEVDKFLAEVDKFLKEVEGYHSDEIRAILGNRPFKSAKERQELWEDLLKVSGLLDKWHAF